ncbi:MAG: NAD(+) synthase [Bacteroidales bacterium]|nr:NAD(+) synthase [Bacteroidales bacterium]
MNKTIQVDKISTIHQILIQGLHDFFSTNGFHQAILGLSGGIDSAVVAALACEALGSENVWGIALPSQFSTDHSIKDAEDLARNLHCRFDIIPIKNGYEAIMQLVQPQFSGTSFGIAEENIQARVRAIVLMALSNKFGHILLNTSNKSEASVGYGTLYGDLCGSLSVIGDIYKTEVYALARYLNRHKEVIPENSIIKPPSAELHPEQKDSDSLPEYDVLDAILIEMRENQKDAQQIVAQGFDSVIVEKVFQLYRRSAFKRLQTAPVIAINR